MKQDSFNKIALIAKHFKVTILTNRDNFVINIWYKLYLIFINGTRKFNISHILELNRK